MYFPYFWKTSGQTAGAKMMEIKVVRDADGGPLTWGAAILRLIGYSISAAVFYIGFIWIFIDKRKRGWFDLIAGTVVIKAAVEESRRPLLRRRLPPAARSDARRSDDEPISCRRRRGGRAVDGGALEKRRVERLRGFESHPLRQSVGRELSRARRRCPARGPGAGL